MLNFCFYYFNIFGGFGGIWGVWRAPEGPGVHFGGVGGSGGLLGGIFGRGRFFCSQTPVRLLHSCGRVKSKIPIPKNILKFHYYFMESLSK